MRRFSKFQISVKKALRGAARPLLPKILFATTTELYSSIVISAATKCHMPFHVNRWLSGTITAGASYLDDFEKWSFFTNDFDKSIYAQIQKKFFKNTKNIANQANQIRKYQLGRKPSLVIIPDVSNNEMIIKETNVFDIPVLGLVSSNCNNEISYPIFANDFSIYSIHFFCHFLSVLITKEIVKNKHKLYIAPKRKNTVKFPQVIKEIFDFNSRVFKLKTYKKKYKEIPYYFKGRYFLDNVFKPKRKIKKNFKYTKKRYFKNQHLKNKSLKNKSLKNKNLKNKNLKNKNLKNKNLKNKNLKNKNLKNKNLKNKNLKNKNLKNKNLKHKNLKNKNFKNKDSKNYFLSPKKLLFIENQKRLEKKKISFYLKKRILPKIDLINKIHHFNFPKITRAIRIPANKPKFRFWKQNRFFFSNSLRFVTNTSLSFQFKRFKLPKLCKKKYWKEKNRLAELEKKNKQSKKNKNKSRFVKKSNVQKNYKTFILLYRKRWSLKKPKKRK